MRRLKIKKSPGQKPRLPLGEYGFIIGNGTSRKDLDVKCLMDYGLFFACNWFFKEEFRPHVLVASDEPMTRTILKKFDRYPKVNWFYTWYPKPGSGAKKAPCPEKFAAGPMATHIAADIYKCKKVFLIGMDFFGFGSKNREQNGVMNNLYEGMKHYAKKPEEGLNGAPTYRNWQRRFQWILRNYPDTEFYHVNPFEDKSPERLKGFNNFHQVKWDNLLDHLQNDTELVDILEKTEEDIQYAYTVNPDDERATIERQYVGQDNTIFPDPMNPIEVLKLRLDVQKKYREMGTYNPGEELVGKINNYNILLSPQIVQEGNIARFASDQEIINIFQKELTERYGLNPLAANALIQQINSPTPSFMPPPKPVVNSFEGLPPPPPPPSS